jgi:hypothetical protein
MNQLPGKKKKLLYSYSRYSSIAFQMLIIILVGVFGGIKLDKWLQFRFPVFTIVLSFTSVVLAIYTVTRDLIKPGKKTEKKGPDHS